MFIKSYVMLSLTVLFLSSCAIVEGTKEDFREARRAAKQQKPAPTFSVPAAEQKPTNLSHPADVGGKMLAPVTQ